MKMVATQQAVWEAADRLKAAGQPVTRDALVALVGGSARTVSTQLDKWKDAQAARPSTLEEQIVGLIAAAKAEDEAHHQAAIKELTDLIGRHAHELAQQRDQFAALSQAWEDEQADLLTMAVAAEERAEEERQRAEKLAVQVQEMAAEMARLQEALATANSENAVMRVDLTRAQTEVSNWRDRHFDAVKRATDAEAREADKKVELAAVKQREDELLERWHQSSRLSAGLEQVNQRLAKVEARFRPVADPSKSPLPSPPPNRANPTT